MAEQLELGRRFQVSKTQDFADGGTIIARYQPGLSYRVTERNRDFVQGMLDEGVATLEAAPAAAGMKVTASRAAAVGSVSVATKKGK